MLTFENLSVSFGDRQILDRVSFALPPGKITVLLGQNGVGKSTLLRCVNGLCPYSGRILLDGTPLSTQSERARARQIGILPQVLPSTNFTVQTLVELGRNPYIGTTGRLSDMDRAQVANAMDTAKVQAFAHRSVDTLSGGERSRVFFAMLLSQDPAVFLLDEPFAALDAPSQKQFCALLRSLTENNGKTILLILHDLTEAVEIADHVVILQEGAVSFVGSREDCLAEGAIEKAFAVRRYVCEDVIFFR